MASTCTYKGWWDLSLIDDRDRRPLFSAFVAVVAVSAYGGPLSRSFEREAHQGSKTAGAANAARAHAKAPPPAKPTSARHNKPRGERT